MDVRRFALRKAFDVHFIDDAIAEGPADVPISFPVECIVDNNALRRPDHAIGRVLTATSQRFGVWIDQASVAVEPLSRFRVKWPVGLQVIELSRLKMRNTNAPNVPPTIVASIEFDYF